MPIEAEQELWASRKTINELEDRLIESVMRENGDQWTHSASEKCGTPFNIAIYV